MFCGDACKMTRLLGSKTCCEVHARLQVRHPELLRTAQAGMLGSRPAVRCKPCSKLGVACNLKQQGVRSWLNQTVPSSLVAQGTSRLGRYFVTHCSRCLVAAFASMCGTLAAPLMRSCSHCNASPLVCLTVMACRSTRSTPLQLLGNRQTLMLNSH